MKHKSRIKTISDTIIDLQDGSQWKLTDISTAIRLPLWMVMDEVEGEDFGLDSHLTNKRRGETLKAKLLR